MRPAKQIFKLLTSSKQAKGLLQRVAHNKQLTSILQANLPLPLASYCQSGELSNNRLTIITTSPVWAAKLRYLLPGLLKQLQTHKTFSQVTEINVKISTHTTSTEDKPKPRRVVSMSPHSAEVLQQTANAIEDKALRESLLRLSLHGKKTKKTEQ